MTMIGEMAMPVAFQYRNVYMKGRPQHDRYDPFRIRHPQMDVGKRAKIFTPFDALRGFDFAILMKNELYTDKRSLSPEDQEELDRRIAILHSLTYNSRIARKHQIQVRVTYYEACSDVNSEAYGLQGQYKAISGICWNVDSEITNTILVDELRIPLEDILKIEALSDIFHRNWEDQSVDW